MFCKLVTCDPFAFILKGAEEGLQELSWPLTGKLLRLTPPPLVLVALVGIGLSAASTIPSPFVSIWISSGGGVLLVLVALVGIGLSGASTIPSPFVSIWISSGGGVLLVLVALVGIGLSGASTTPPFVSIWISSGGGVLLVGCVSWNWIISSIYTITVCIHLDFFRWWL